MTIEVDCRTTAEAEAAIAAGNVPVLRGTFTLDLRASVRVVVREGRPLIRSHGTSAPRMESYGTSAPRMVSHGTSAPRMVSHDTSAPRMVSYDTSAPRMVSHGTSAPRMESYGTSAPTMVSHGTSAPTMESHGTSAPTMESHGTSAPRMVSYDTSAPTMVSYDTSAPRMVSHDTSAPTMVSHGTSAPRMVSYGTSAPTMVSHGTSAPRMTAHGAVQLRVRGNATVVAAATVAICILGGNPQITGGGYIHRVDCSTPAKWCEHYGVAIVDGFALLAKGVQAAYTSAKGAVYAPGKKVNAPDWDGGARECGGGLHFSPRPSMTREFEQAPKHFLICPVKLTDIAVHPDGTYPQKVKARAVSAPIWECDEDGKPLTDRDRKLQAAFMAAHSGKPKRARKTKRVAKKGSRS